MAHEEAESEETGRSLARNSTLDVVVAGIVLLLGVVVVIEARRLGAGWTTDGPGPGYFPFYIGLILALGGAVIGAKAIAQRRDDESTFVDSVQLRRILSVLVPSAIYVAAIMALGLYVASAIFIALFMIVLGKYSKVKSILVGFGVNALFFLMFEVWFKVPLYKGSLDLLGFLGY